MPQISKEQIEQVREIFSLGEGAYRSDIRKVDDLLQSLLDQPEGEPVAWHTEDHLTDRSATTYNKNMMHEWLYKGWSVTPLYTHPPAPRKQITAEDVTDEVVDAVEDVVIARPDEWDVVDPKEIIAAAVNAYLKGKL